MKLGDHKGNRFIIVLRNVQGSKEEIDEAMISLRDHGFINYYGMQRFGTTRVSTHQVGRSLLLGNWSEAIDLILCPRPGDRPEVSEARLTWQKTKNAQAAVKALKSFHCMERFLLEGLARFSKNDLVSALARIPRNMRMMYTHAFQSYIWNHVVSRRISELGAQPCVGDLVLSGQSEENLEETAADTEDEVIRRPVPYIVTADSLSKYTVFDIVLPLPGYDVQYPDNVSASYYKDILTQSGMEDCNFKHAVRDYSLPGSYRRIVIQPQDLSWHLINYDDYEKSLVDSDYELLQPTPVSTSSQPAVEGKYQAMKVEMTLVSSAYATMALREVLKCGTSSAYQSTLNVT